MPRARPSLSASMTHRTRLRPICWATSMTRSLPSTATERASFIFGSRPGSKTASTTDPDTCVMVPFVIAGSLLPNAVRRASVPERRRKFL